MKEEANVRPQSVVVVPRHRHMVVWPQRRCDLFDDVDVFFAPHCAKPDEKEMVVKFRTLLSRVKPS